MDAAINPSLVDAAINPSLVDSRSTQRKRRAAPAYAAAAGMILRYIVPQFSDDVLTLAYICLRNWQACSVVSKIYFTT